MQTYRDHESLARLACTEDTLGLHALVQDSLSGDAFHGLNDLASLLHIVVMGEVDTPQALEQHLGFTILHNRWNGLACDHSGFTPSWDALEVYAHWYVLTFIQSDDGFGIVVFVPRRACHELVALCGRYAREYGLQ